MEQQSNYITLKQAAELSGVSYAALRREVEKGRLPAFRVGRKYFLAAAEVAKYAASSMVDAEGYTIRQIMEMLPLSYAFIIELIHDGRLKAVKRGRRYIIPEDALADFLEQARQ